MKLWRICHASVQKHKDLQTFCTHFCISISVSIFEHFHNDSQHVVSVLCRDCCNFSETLWLYKSYSYRRQFFTSVTFCAQQLGNVLSISFPTMAIIRFEQSHIKEKPYFIGIKICLWELTEMLIPLLGMFFFFNSCILLKFYILTFTAYALAAGDLTLILCSQMWN